MKTLTARISEIEIIDENRKNEFLKITRSDLQLDPRTDKRVVRRLARDVPSLKKIRLQLDEHLEFEPGQFINIYYDGDDIDGNELETPLIRQYSISNSPEDAHRNGHTELELCVRKVEQEYGGNFTPILFEKLGEQDTLEILPSVGGHFTVNEQPDRDQVFIGTGTGVAPLKSMIDHLYDAVLEDDPDQDVWLFYGARWEDDLAYVEELCELERDHDNFHFVPALSGELGWEGESDYVQEVVRKYIDDLGELDPDSIEAYICGLEPMVNQAVHVLTGDDSHVTGDDYRPPDKLLTNPLDPEFVHSERYS